MRDAGLGQQGLPPALTSADAVNGPDQQIVDVKTRQIRAMAYGRYGAVVSEVIAERYRLVAALGEGGMGRVWQARDELLGRDVALKELVLPRGLSEPEIRDLRERAIREARAIARIDHPNVVRIFDVFLDEGSPWIVMELVVGRSLFEDVRDDGPMEPERAARIGLAVLAALRAAHRAGVLHRDVKPANVLLGDDGRVKLSDFGLAATTGDSGMTSTGIVLGSPSYLAPERALDEEITAAADLWSLGATLYAAVEGRPPYVKSTPMATLAALATQPPRPAEQAGVLLPVLEGLLRKDPVERIGSDEAEDLLRAAAAGVMAEVSAPARPEVTAPAGAPAMITPAGAAGNGVAGGPAGAEENTAGTGEGGGRRKNLVWWAGIAAVLVLAAVIAGRPVFNTDADADVLPAPLSSTGSTELPISAPTASPVPSKSTQASPSATKSPAAAPVTASAKPRVTTAKPAPTGTKKAVVAGRQMQNMQTGTCLQLITGSGTIVMWTCNGSDAQKFDLPGDGSMRVLGQCVRILGTDNGAHLGTGACDGSAGTQWDFNSSFDLVNLEVVKCADVPDGAAGDGVAAQIWGCNGTGNQKWRH
jgi:tRNA A-37 threonylcarbamoyl transferase component Bud32